MIELTLSILFTICLFLFFKEFDRRKVDTLEAITFNYLSAGLLSIAFGSSGYSLESTLYTDWFIPTVFLGIFFIVMFNIMALTTQKLGVTIGSLASKMSLIIPVIFALLFQGDSWTALKTIGIVIALLSVYLTVKKNEEKNGPIYLAILLFVGAGLLDTVLSHIQFKYLDSQALKDYFTTTVFLVAFCVGFLMLIIKKQKFKIRNIVFGLSLGIPNYLSILFVLKSLNKMDSSLVFPILNIGVVVLSALVGWGYYKEQLSKLNWLGVILAIVSICILIYS
jgi:drug/metabolite transporter (DMT)-like permease|tara:strand:- start:2868 stop:3707 length:840 start_codon:yes stop_codon:yes gene_type:complete